MSYEKSIRPVPYSPDLTPAEEHLRMSRIVAGVNDWLGSPAWSDSEVAERNYGWPIPPSNRHNLGEALDEDGTDENRQLGESAIAFALLQNDEGEISYVRVKDATTDVD